MTGIILAGGQSRRVGFNKALAEVGGIPIIERAQKVLEGLFQEVFIVALEKEPYDHLGIPVHVDLKPGCHALGGILTGLHYASSSESFICACDMPFLNPDLIRYQMELSSRHQVVLPRGPSGFLEALHATYRKDCLPVIEQHLKRGDFAIHKVLSELDLRVIEGEELQRLDPDGLSFFNVNTQEELEKARSLARGKGR